MFGLNSCDVRRHIRPFHRWPARFTDLLDPSSLVVTTYAYDAWHCTAIRSIAILLAEGFFALRHFNRPILDIHKSDGRLDHFILEQTFV